MGRASYIGNTCTKLVGTIAIQIVFMAFSRNLVRYSYKKGTKEQLAL